MTGRVRAFTSPQVGSKQRAKSRRLPLGYALSPRVNTVPGVRRSIAEVRLSPLPSQVETSPAPISTAGAAGAGFVGAAGAGFAGADGTGVGTPVAGAPVDGGM